MNTVPTHNKHIFVRLKKSMIRMGKVLIMSVLIMSGQSICCNTQCFGDQDALYQLSKPSSFFLVFLLYK